MAALQRWLDLAGITDGPVFRGATKANRAGQRRLHPESVTILVKGAFARTGAPTTGFSGHSLRAGFVTYAHLRGSGDRAIAHQTRHRSMASLGGYVRVSHAWTDNALAEAFNSLFKAELGRNRGPWKGIEDLEIAVAEYIDWFNHRRLHGELGLVPPVEFEADYYASVAGISVPATVEASVPTLKQSRGETPRPGT